MAHGTPIPTPQSVKRDSAGRAPSPSGPRANDNRDHAALIDHPDTTHQPMWLDHERARMLGEAEGTTLYPSPRRQSPEEAARMAENFERLHDDDDDPWISIGGLIVLCVLAGSAIWISIGMWIFGA